MRPSLLLHPAAAVAAALLAVTLVTLPSRAAEPEPAAIAWGEVRDGLQAGIRIPAGKLTYRQGEPLRAEVVLRNTTTKSIQVSHWVPTLWSAKRSGDRITLQLRSSDAGYVQMDASILSAGEQMAAPVAPPAVILREPGWKGDPTDYAIPTLRLPAGTYQLSAASALRTDTTDEGEKRGRVPTGILEIKVLADPPVADSPALTPYRIAWGDVKQGLQLGSSFMQGRTSYQVDEVVPFNLHVRNVSDQPKPLRHWNYPASDYSPEVTDAAGNRVQVDVTRLTIFPFAMDRTLQPREALIVAHPRLVLAPPSQLDKQSITPTMATVPGKYRLRHHTIFGLTGKPEGFTGFNSGELTMEVPARARNGRP